MSKAFAAIYVVAVLALAACVVLIWRLRCESFGCMGIGVAWFAWVLAYFPVLLVGVLVRSRESLGAGLRKLMRAAVWAQVAMGAALAVVWVLKQAG
ncbi:hypothetical protein [Niveibacterium microcysteis]|uniref:Transmembrane protein n=1 Tax=Niveibacterium microcysteis TaxID=2811415 RepID=A0ABX7M9U2_9RHOO|nr:hypothetical protein [Niveibacterium microcysteis]QSI78516.1 hypothetical protein JY500_07860 [Niveibacterium microcysteis]